MRRVLVIEQSSIEEPRRVIRKSLALAALIAATVAGACTPEAATPRCPPGKLCLHAGNGSEPNSLDPHKATGTWENTIISDMIVGLTTDDAAGKPIPGMAERWETSADGLTWTFHLREASWSDGTPVTADDFVFAIRRIMDPETASEYASLLYVIKGAQAANEGKGPLEAIAVRAVNPRTVEYVLNNPAPYLPELATHYTMYPVPKHVVEKNPSDWVQPGSYVANGPYTLAENRLGDYVRLVKNPRFYDAANVCLDEIYYYPTRDAISAERRVKRGELHLNSDIQSNRIAFLRRSDQIPEYVHTNIWLGVAYLAPNKAVPAFRDVRVRQAMSMAIDREFITDKLLRGGQVPAYAFVPPGVAAYPGGVKPHWADWTLERRQAEARRLLAAAGYGPERPLTFEIKHRNSPDPMLWMPAVQADLAQVGIKATLTQNETQIAYAAYRSRDFEMADAAWIADYNDAMSFLYLQESSTGSQNYGDYNNPRYDALLKSANNEPDAERRAEYMKAAEQVLVDDAGVLPVYFYVNKNLVNPNVTGFVNNLVDKHRKRFMCFKDAANRRGVAKVSIP
jgi:oligopeptide transport system substrate-binding protein